MAPAPIPPPRESGFTRTTSVPLYWASYGSATSPALLVLHGGPGAQHDYLLPQMLELSSDFRLMFYDQRGGGRSKSDDRDPVTWKALVEDLDRVIPELGEPSAIVGYSWGGLLAMLHAIEGVAGRARYRADRLVLIDPAPVTRGYRRLFEEEFARRQAGPEIAGMREALASSGLRERDPEAYRQRAFELSVAGYFANPKRARELTPFRVIGRVQQSVWESLGDFDLVAPGHLELVTARTLIVHGRQDPIPLSSSEAAASAMRARLIAIDDCGHVPYVEQPAQLFAAIRAFLESTV